MLKYFIIAGLIYSTPAIGQDIQFSQFYAVALYQNPGFAGSTHNYRGTFHQRLQWPGLDAKYITSLFSVDGYSNKYNSGYSLMVFKDWQGSNTINSFDLGLQYAYELHLNSSLSFRPGLQLSYVSRNINYTGLTLPEDFDNNGQIGTPMLGGSNKKYADISSGGILYNNQMWLGFSAHHINMPNQSFIDGVSRLPVKFAFTGGYKIFLRKEGHQKVYYLQSDEEFSITPTFHYKLQGKSDQLDIGFYGRYNFIMAGIWYRGIPIKHYQRGLQNSESFIAMVGWKYQNLSITYSYDITISRLVRARTGGSHELNVTYVYQKHKSYRPQKRLPCPNFHH